MGHSYCNRIKTRLQKTVLSDERRKTRLALPGEVLASSDYSALSMEKKIISIGESVSEKLTEPMGSHSKVPDSSKSEDDELPRFTFLQHLSKGSGPLVVLDSSDSDESCPSPTGCFRPKQSKTIPCDKIITMISSESEEEEIVSLTERLKGKFMTSNSVSSLSVPQQLSTKDSVYKAGCDGLSTNSKIQTSVKAQQEWQATAVSSGWTLDCDQDSVTWTLQGAPVWQLELPDSIDDAQRVEKDPLVPPPQKRLKRSQEEMERAQQEALRRRKAREHLQADGGKMCQEKERARKAQRPKECLQHIQVLIDPALLQSEGGGQLLSALQAMESNCVIENQMLPYSISWKRRVVAYQVEEETWLEEPSVIVLVPREEFVSMIHSSKQEVCSERSGAQQNLQSFVEHCMVKSAGKTISLVIMEMDKYFRIQKNQPQKSVLNKGARNAQERRRKGNEAALPSLSRVDMEEVLVDLQLHTGVQVRFLETWKEFADYTSMFTKAVAEAPFKHERDKSGFSFCVEGDWSGGVKVDRCGKGLLQVWKRQVQQLNRISVEIASAVVSKYPSPQLLIQAYRRCVSEYERQYLLADILVRRGEGIISTCKRIGPELSKRIYLQMTSDLPELLLEMTP